MIAQRAPAVAPQKKHGGLTPKFVTSSVVCARAVFARLGGKVVVVVVEAPTCSPMKGKITKNYPQV